MLARRPLSEGEIRDRLLRRGFPDSDAGTVLARLRELRLVDDRALAASLARSYLESRRYGQVRIAWALRARLFLPDVIAEALRETSSPEEQMTAAVSALRKKFRGGVPPGRTGAAKAYRFLSSRGFSPETCRKAIDAAGFDIQEGE